MADDAPIEEEELAAGAFSAWLVDMGRALRGEGQSDVPCGGCTGCCTSSQFIHIGPDELDTLAHIPTALLFPTPRRPRGHVLMGYDERGHCPMLIDGQCSIYDHRPKTCRTYDCRVFPASGLALDDDPDKAQIARRARRWRFDHPAELDSVEHAAVRAAARYLQQRRGDFGEGELPGNATQLAVLAIELHELFLGSADPDPVAVRVELRRHAV